MFTNRKGKSLKEKTTFDFTKHVSIVQRSSLVVRGKLHDMNLNI